MYLLNVMLWQIINQYFLGTLKLVLTTCNITRVKMMDQQNNIMLKLHQLVKNRKILKAKLMADFDVGYGKENTSFKNNVEVLGIS
jgi:hypothetical protein